MHIPMKQIDDERRPSNFLAFNLRKTLDTPLNLIKEKAKSH